MGLAATALPVLVMSFALIASYWLGNSSGGCCSGTPPRQLMFTVVPPPEVQCTSSAVRRACLQQQVEVVVHFGLVCLFAACVL